MDLLNTIDDGAAGTRQRRARIEDVAAEADVSVATVSRALRNLPNVAASTRQRVFDVAARLNYRADPVASRLAGQRTSTVIVLVPHLASWYFSTVVAGAEAVCAEAGYDFMVVGVGGMPEFHRLLHEHQQMERRADGLIAFNIPVRDADAASLRRRGIALSTVGTTVPGAPSVLVDDLDVGRLAADTLWSLGHRRIGLISGQGNDPMNFDVPKLRRRGFAERLDALGAPLDPALVRPGNFGIDGGHEAATRLLDGDDPPTALFAMSDEMAFGALMALRHAELRPGVDVSLLGVDDHEFSRVVGLSTIRQQVPDQGATAARLLLAQLTDREGPIEHIFSPTELVERATTGRCPVAAPSRSA